MHPSRTAAVRLVCMGVALMGSSLGCTEAPDVVAAELSSDAGSQTDAATDARDAAMEHVVDRCDQAERYKRARIPATIVLDLYRMKCKIPLSDFMNPGGEVMISEKELSQLLNAPRLEPIGDISAAFFCDGANGGYYLEPWNHPQRLVLCPATCLAAKQFVDDRLDGDGCEQPFDDDAGM